MTVGGQMGGCKDSVFVGLRDRLGTECPYSKFVVSNFTFWCSSSFLVLVLYNLKRRALPVSVGNHCHLEAIFEENLVLTFRKSKSCFQAFEDFIFISFKVMFIY